MQQNERVGNGRSGVRSTSGVRETDSSDAPTAFGTGIAKVFYCGGLSGRLGTLRAIVPVADLQNALSKDSPMYVGKSFPKMKEDGTVIEIVSDDQGIWKAGFYRTAKTPLDFEDHLRGL